jgi:MFS transporter, PAT family, beta-lactamase induction signal transducer AmpG
MSQSSSNAPAAPIADKRSWRAALAVYTEASSLRMLALGFSAGLPLVLVFGTLSYWLREAGINRATIGFISWVTLAYAIKWCWSPLVDRMPIPLLTRVLGRRRSWLLVSQICVIVGLIGMAHTDPKADVMPIVWFALFVAFASATQDIALDAFRIESSNEDKQAALSAAYQAGYRIAMIWASAGALKIAARTEVANVSNYDVNAWKIAYLAMAASMVIGIATVLLSREPAGKVAPPPRNLQRWIAEAITEPFADFFKRYRGEAMLILALVSLYRISDIVLGVMANPFYVDMGFSKDEVAEITKVFGLIMTLIGAFVGGALSVKFGVMRVLMLGAVLSAASNLLFAWLSTRGHDTTALKMVISLDNLSTGIASTAFIAYMSSLTNIAYTATQYALLSSMMKLIPEWLAGFSGVAVNNLGYAHFFIGTALLGLPVLVLIWFASKKQM